MRAMYGARVFHFGPGDCVKVECICGHVALLTVTMLIASAGRFSPREPLDSRVFL